MESGEETSLLTTRGPNRKADGWPLQESLNFRPRTGLVTAKGEADKAGAERPTAATLTWTTTLQLQTAWGTQA